MSRDRNADYNMVARTNEFVDVHAPPAARPLGGGPFVERVACPLCRTNTDLFQSLRGPEGRCTGCTVVVRLVHGKAKACGWMGGGDLAKAGRAVRRRRSKFERPEPTPKPVTKPTLLPSTAVPCGTVHAAKRHMKRKEHLDDACRDVYNAYQREKRAEYKARRELAA